MDRGFFHETGPWGGAATQCPVAGRFTHEAAAGPVRRAVYTTGDVSHGCFSRFLPATWGELPAGTLSSRTGRSR